MSTMTLVLVRSDNFEDAVFTKEAYKELTLTMSTGDFHTHKHVEFELSLNDYKIFRPSEPIIELDAEIGEFYWTLTFRDLFEEAFGRQDWNSSEPTNSHEAEILVFDLNKAKDLTPRERLIKNQRKLFNIEAEIIPLFRKAV